MCHYCSLATQLAGHGYMCRPCWRRQHRNRVKQKR